MGNTYAQLVGNPDSGNPPNSHDPLPALQELEREVTRNPLRVNIVLERLSSASDTSKSAKENDENEATDPKDKNATQHSPIQPDDLEQENENSAQDNTTTQDTDDSDEVKGAEQFMRVVVPIPRELREFHQHLTSGQRSCHVILVADCSGSMAGNPWNQVKGALVNIVSTSLQKRGLVIDILTYNKSATRVQFTPSNYSAVISSMAASGTTSFVAAMDKVDEVMKKEKGKEFASTAIMFMTDGQDTVTSAAQVRERMQQWKERLQACQHEVTTHAVGFTTGHDFEFLRELTQVGTRPGLFRYCEPSDGPEVLQLKMEELFDYAVYSAEQTIDVTVEMNGKNRIVGAGSMTPTHTVPGETIHSDQATGADGDLTAGPGEITVQAEMWVWVPNPAELPAPVVYLSKTVVSNGDRHTVKLPCTCASVEERVIDNAVEKALWELNILSRNVDVLATEIANAIQEKKDATIFQKRLTRLQSRLSNTKVFGSKIDKDTRESLLSMMKTVQTKMDTMHSMLAQYSRGETASVSILARAHDLRYEAQFKKSRRQRVMNKRAVQNVRRAKVDDAKLEQLTVDEDEISRLSQEAVEFFFCTLSQESVVDILRDTDNKENAIGFGLAVCRPEYVVDSPTSLQLCLVSGTLVSRSSMLDALEFKVNLAGQLAAHNGFNFFHRGQQGQGDGGQSLGYATVGVGREPINAWLPLYVTPSHWNRVKVLMKPTLGYLCTLDPLGFDWAQLDVPFAVLGAMIGQLNEATVGTHQLRLLFSFLRTCVACVDEFNLTNRILNIVRTFLREPVGRFKHVVPNLFTLIGYIAALPVSQSRKILGYEEEGREPDQFPTALWYAFLAEILRRSAGSLFKPYSDRDRNILLDLLLHGRKNSLMLDKVQEASCTATQTATNIAGKVQDTTCTATLSTAAAVASTSEASTSAASTPSSQTAPQADGSVATSAVTVAEEAQCLSDLSQQTSARFTSLCSSMTRQSADLTIQEVDKGGDADGDQASKGRQAAQEKAARPVVEFQHCPKMDASMEIWARSQLSALENKSQEKKVSSSKKQVEEWLREGRQAAGLSEDDTTKNQEEELFDCDAVDSSVLEITAKLLSQLSKNSSFPLSSLPGVMAFLHAWMSKDRDLQDMSDGLPPDQWIQDIKAGITHIYSNMHDYVAQCQQQVSSDDIEEVVIVEGASRAEGSSGSRQHGGKRSDEASDDDDDDDSDFEDYDLDEDDPMKVLKRRQQEYRSLVTLPMVLHALDPCENKVKVTRAMLCQAVIHHSNAAAKEAFNEGQFVDLKTLESVEDLMTKLHRHLVRVCRTGQTDSILWQRANLYLMSSVNIWAFLGYLMNSYKDRHEGFSWLLMDISELEEGSRVVPCVAEKVRVLLTGQWQGHNVLARGNSCMPGNALSKKLMKVLGEDEWLQIDLDLRGDLKIHVYRESDIPNRHGHCNSNPYIPPALRLRLGMPSLGSSSK